MPKLRQEYGGARCGLRLILPLTGRIVLSDSIHTWGGGTLHKTFCVAASAALLGLTSGAQAHDVTRHSHGAYGDDIVLVSCYRGPWEAVIWDRPNPIFIETLEATGLSSKDAIRIAEAVCRDPRLVGNRAAMAKQVQRLVAEVRRG